MPGSWPAPQHSSQTTKAKIPAAAGQCPSRSGYGSGSVASPRVSRPAAQPAARPIARHGLNSRNTSPPSSETNGTPTQKPTYTAVGARLSCWESVPASPA